ncbi:MAG: HD domain-containing phosphohydrolase [Pelovirga sp.]
MLQAAAIVAREHHEKWDGSGYPAGTCGEQIHIYGRITAVADVFDALGSDRVYKQAWPLEKILKLMEQERGKHFDPRLIDLFQSNLERFLAIRDRYKDLPG